MPGLRYSPYKRNAFMTAVRKGRIDRVREIISSRGPCYVEEWKGGYSLLRTALEKKHTEIATLLLTSDSEVNNRNKSSCNTPLHHAIVNRDVQFVRMLLDKGANINVKNTHGRTPLHNAVQIMQTEIITMLLNQGANLNAADESNVTPLHLAVANNNKAIINLLLSRGANVDGKGNNAAASRHIAMDKGDGSTPLHLAVGKDNEEITELLLSRGVNVNAKKNNGTTALYIATTQGYSEIVKHLLKYGAEINSVYNSSFREGYTALHCAVERGSLAIIEMLLSKGADVNAIGECGATPLHLATQHGSLKIVEYLLKNGACANSAYTSTFREGYTSLHLAVGNGNEGITELLLSNGANVNAEGIAGITSLRIATQEGYLKIVEHLLKYGARINSTSENGPTPLHLAVENGHEKIVNLLLECGGDVNSKDENGKTILHLAVQRGCSITVGHILKHCPDLNVKSNSSVLNVAVHGYGIGYSKIVMDLLEYGFTVNPIDANNFMHAAVEKGYVELVEELLKHGTDVNKLYKSTLGKYSIPLHVATKNGQEEVAELLISYGADVNAPDKTGNTPIFYATENANVKITKLLLAHKANVNNKLKLLNIAVKKDCREIVEIFLQLGADVNATDTHGRTPLHFVVIEKEQKRFESPRSDPNAMGEVAKLLLSRGANANTRVKNYMTFHWGADTNPSCVTTMLHAATDKGYVKVVEGLLEYNADVNSTHEDGMTPLHVAAQRGNAVITKMLLNKGANINAERRGGMTALFCATERGHKEVVEVLVKCGAKIDARTIHKSMTPLHIAVECGHPKTVELLLQLGADIDSRDKCGMTSLHIACRRDHEEIVEILLEHGSDITIRSKNNCTAFGFAYGYDDYDDTDFNYYEDDRDTSPHENIADILERHMVKIIAAHLYASHEITVSIPSFTSRDFSEGIADLEDENEDEMGNMYNNRVRKERKLNINELQNKCEKEVERMKCEKVANANITFYDILSKDVSRLAMYARNRSIVEAFESGDYKKKFPIYGSMINNNFRKGERRNEFLERSNKILDHLFNNSPVIPRDCTERILSYLTDVDLRALVDVGMLTVHCQ